MRGTVGDYRGVVGLVLFHGAVVVDEDVRGFVVGHLVAGRAGVPRAEVALGVIRWERGLRRRLLLASAKYQPMPITPSPGKTYCHGRFVR